MQIGFDPGQAATLSSPQLPNLVGGSGHRGEFTPQGHAAHVPGNALKNLARLLAAAKLVSGGHHHEPAATGVAVGEHPLNPRQIHPCIVTPVIPGNRNIDLGQIPPGILDERHGVGFGILHHLVHIQRHAQQFLQPEVQTKLVAGHEINAAGNRARHTLEIGRAHHAHPTVDRFAPVPGNGLAHLDGRRAEAHNDDLGHRPLRGSTQVRDHGFEIANALGEHEVPVLPAG